MHSDLISDSILENIKQKFQDHYFDLHYTNCYKIYNKKQCYYITFVGEEIYFNFKTFNIKHPTSIKRLMKLMRKTLNVS